MSVWQAWATPLALALPILDAVARRHRVGAAGRDGLTTPEGRVLPPGVAGFYAKALGGR